VQIVKNSGVIDMGRGHAVKLLVSEQILNSTSAQIGYTEPFK